jgi:hypothetical protein
MAASLLQIFRDLNMGIKDSIADLTSPLLQSFAALSIANEQASAERLSVEHIVACLEAAGTAVSKRSVSSALSRAGDRVSVTKGIDGENLYRLMIKGEREIAPHIGGGGISIVRFDGKKPRTARVRLGDALSSLTGLVRICDPWYGVRTLDSLDLIPLSCRVRFLTAKTNEAGSRLRGAMRDFKRERPDVEFRIAASPNDLHDRYVLSVGQMLLVGHGLKDIGAKESFMVRVDKGLAKELIAQTRASFDAKWKIAIPI